MTYATYGIISHQTFTKNMKTKQKTKKEIILETAGAYTSETRSMASEACAYKAGENKCAVGRCLSNRSKLFSGVYNTQPVSLIGIDIELELKPEYRGHSRTFWGDVQSLHDQRSNWDENGLSDKGKKMVEALLKYWGRDDE